MILKDGTVQVVVGAKPYIRSGSRLCYDGGEQDIFIGGNLDDVIARFNVIKVKYVGEYTNLLLEDYDDGYRDCSCRTSYRVIGTRKATQLEIDWYQEQEAKRAADSDERERAEFERLRAKFG